MPVLYITINSSNFQSVLVLIFVGMQYKLNNTNTFVEAFVKITATMYLIALARFFKVTCCDIFEHLLAISSKNGGLLGPISTYFGIVETNG